MNSFKKYFEKDELFKQKSILLYNKLINDYNNKIIKNDTEFLYLLKTGLNKLYLSITNKNYKFIPAYFTPSSEDYNNMISNGIEDIQTILDYSNIYADKIQSDINDTVINKDYFVNNIEKYKTMLTYLSDSVESYSLGNNINFTNKFSDNNVLNSMVNKTLNILTLPYESMEVTKEYSVKVIDSNGFPGNTHIIDNSINNVTFEGENSINANIENIKDNNKALEYEIFEVDNNTYNNCNGHGFNYKEGFSWITDDKELRLTIRITPSNSYLKQYNSIVIKPFVPPQNTYYAATIEKVIVYNIDSTIESYQLNEVFDDTTIINFTKQNVKYIDIFFKQDNPYIVDIGHFYTLRNDNNESYYDTYSANIPFNRIERYNPSITSLGLSVNSKTGEIIQPDSESEYTFSNTQAVNDLFSIPEEHNNDKSGIEVIKAKRYMIGIESIEIMKTEYQNDGTYISEEYQTDDEIKTVSLYVNDECPLNDNEGYLEYFITFDGGTTWHKINPKERSYLGNCEIRINSSEKHNKNNEKIYYLDRLLDTKKLQLKIVMHKESNVPKYISPIVYSYRIEVETESDFFEYK